MKLCRRAGGGSLSRFMAETSVDEFFLWLADETMELDEPTRVEHYLIQILHYLFDIPFRVWGQESKVDADKHRLTFTRGRPVVDEDVEAEKAGALDELDEARRAASESWAVWGPTLAAVAEEQERRKKEGVVPETPPDSRFLYPPEFGKIIDTMPNG